MLQKLVVSKLVSNLISGVIVNWSRAIFLDWLYNMPHHTLSLRDEAIISYFHQEYDTYCTVYCQYKSYNDLITTTHVPSQPFR